MSDRGKQVCTKAGRLRCFAGRWLLLAAAVVGVAWAVSPWLWCRVIWGQVSTSVSGGRFFWTPLGERDDRVPGVKWDWSSRAWFAWWLGIEDIDGDGLWMPERRRGVYQWSTAGHDDSEKRIAWGVLMWPVVLATGVPGALLLVSGRRAARRAGAGLCAGCGYDLKGLGAGGVCPECGAKGQGTNID